MYISHTKLGIKMIKIDDVIILILIIAIVALSLGLTYETQYDNIIGIIASALAVGLILGRKRR
ncbi:hypothetical protein DRO35_05360 [Candidatus Bathyarchaeota archaeon]|nr:MAG: hypothetical protein DRO35_05360 [Candidatus Bathyarchaeota archaeon]